MNVSRCLCILYSRSKCVVDLLPLKCCSELVFWWTWSQVLLLCRKSFLPILLFAKLITASQYCWLCWILWMGPISGNDHEGNVRIRLRVRKKKNNFCILFWYDKVLRHCFAYFWMHMGMKDVSNYKHFFFKHPCQPFGRDFFLLSSYSLKKRYIFSMPETALVYFCE